MAAPKTKHLKHLSLFDLFIQYATEEQQVEFFFDIKWPQGFICPNCGHCHYTYYAARHIYECTECHHQTSLTSGTIMQDTKLPLLVWIFMIYLICDSSNGISALELSRKVGISVKSATLNSRKIKCAMMLRNTDYKLFNCAEHDEIYIGAPTKNGKRGLGTEKQLVYTQVGIENNCYPTFVKFTMGDRITTQAILEALVKNVQPGAKLITDGNKAYPGLEPTFVIEAQKNDYEKHPEHLLWLNTIVSNLKTFLQGTYHGIAKRYLILSLAEFEWRFNRRKIGKGKLKSGLRTVMAATPMTCKNLVEFFAIKSA